MFLFGPKNRVGLDMGTDSIKVAESQGGKKIIYYSILPINLPQETFNSEIRIKKKSDLLKKIYRERNLKEKDIYTSVEGESVMVKYLELPKLSKDELEVALPIEIDRMFPFQRDDIIINRKSVDVLSGDRSKMALVISAIPLSIVDDMRSLFSIQSSLSAEKISVPSTIALGRIMRYIIPGILPLEEGISLSLLLQASGYRLKKLRKLNLIMTYDSIKTPTSMQHLIHGQRKSREPRSFTKQGLPQNP